MNTAAEFIKVDLASHFPETYFLIEYSIPVQGDTVSVSWENGPSLSDVDSLVGKYRMGYYDPISGTYIATRKSTNLPVVRFVKLNRHILPHKKNRYHKYKIIMGMENFLGINDTVINNPIETPVIGQIFTFGQLQKKFGKLDGRLEAVPGEFIDQKYYASFLKGSIRSDLNLERID